MKERQREKHPHTHTPTETDREVHTYMEVSGRTCGRKEKEEKKRSHERKAFKVTESFML